MRLHTQSKETLPTQSTLCQVIEQGRWRDLLCEKIGPLPALLERAATLSAGREVSFADALEQAIQETGGTVRSIFAEESEALAHDVGCGGAAAQLVVIDLDEHRIRVEYDHRAGSLRESLEALKQSFPYDAGGGTGVQSDLGPKLKL